jgi:DNA repair protein RAD5
VKPLRSNALLLAQKKNGRAVINETSLKHFDSNGVKPPPSALARRSASPSKSSSSGKGKEKGSARNSDDEDEDSGDEADQIYRKCVVMATESWKNFSLGESSLMSRHRAQQGDTRLDETDPPDTFLYTLRPYQKQALTWMNAREAGDETVRDQGLHPLWEE